MTFLRVAIFSFFLCGVFPPSVIAAKTIRCLSDFGVLQNEAKQNMLLQLTQAVDPHSIFSSLEKVTFNVDAGGPLFTLKGQRKAFRGKRITVFLHEEKVVVDDFPKKGSTGIYLGDSVIIRDENGEVVFNNPRKKMKNKGFLATWSDADILYFFGYALSNYLRFPFSLDNPDIKIRKIELAGRNKRKYAFGIEVTYPKGYHTHCRAQRYYFDAEGLVRQHTYKVVVGHGLRATHYTRKWRLPENEREFAVPLSRTVDAVLPSLFGLPIPGGLTGRVSDLNFVFLD